MNKQSVQPEGNYFDKYHSRNPIVKWMMKGFFDSVDRMLGEMKEAPARILEAGCGEGEVTAFLRERFPGAWIDAFDISEKVVAGASGQNPDIHFYVGDIYTMQGRAPLTQERIHFAGGGKYGLVVCSEVLEHLEEPERALERLAELSDRYVLLSVPNEPIWRILNMLRGKYWRNWGNTPGHIQHWSKRAFCRMLEQKGFRLIKVKSPFPWTMVLAVPG